MNCDAEAVGWGNQAWGTTAWGGNAFIALVVVTGIITSDGSAIVEFYGPANKGLIWSITEGTGAITPINNYTDQYGRAFARYDAGGYVGPVQFEVRYGT